MWAIIIRAESGRRVDVYFCIAWRDSEMYYRTAFRVNAYLPALKLNIIEWLWISGYLSTKFELFFRLTFGYFFSVTQAMPKSIAMDYSMRTGGRNVFSIDFSFDRQQMDTRLKPKAYWTYSFTQFSHKICALNYPFGLDTTQNVCSVYCGTLFPEHRCRTHHHEHQIKRVYRYVDNIPSTPFVLLKHVNPFRARKVRIISVRFRQKFRFAESCIKKNGKNKYLLVFLFVTLSHINHSQYLHTYGRSERQYCWNWTEPHHIEDIGRLFLTDGRRLDQTKPQPKLQSHFCATADAAMNCSLLHILLTSIYISLIDCWCV